MDHCQEYKYRFQISLFVQTHIQKSICVDARTQQNVVLAVFLKYTLLHIYNLTVFYQLSVNMLPRICFEDKFSQILHVAPLTKENEYLNLWKYYLHSKVHFIKLQSSKCIAACFKYSPITQPKWEMSLCE